MSDISYSKFLIKSKFNPKKAKKYMESYDKIMESGLFDKNYYLKAYPHIAKSGMDPLVHYLFYGYKEDKNPSAQFNLKRYLEEYPEIKKMGLNPLVHYIDNDHEGFTLEENPFVARRKEILDTNSRIVENEENVSFSKGNNDAAKIANGEYLILLNNDIEPTYGWLNEMVGTILNNENVGSVGAKLIFPYYEDMKNQGKSFSIQHAGVKFREERTPYIYGPYHEHMYSTMLFSDELNHQKEVISNTAACLLVPKDVYFELDGLDEQYIYGYEDIDFAFKLYNAGYKTLYNPAVLLFHHESATRHEDDDWKNQLNYHNIMHFADKWGDFIFKEILKDKIEANNFFTNKKLDFTIVGKNNDLIKKAVFKLNSEGYNVKLVPNIGDLDIGQDCDILISTEKEYDIKNVSSRLNLIKISDEDNDGYDMVLSENDFEFNLLDKIKEKYL